MIVKSTLSPTGSYVIVGSAKLKLEKIMTSRLELHDSVKLLCNSKQTQFLQKTITNFSNFEKLESRIELNNFRCTVINDLVMICSSKNFNK